MLRLTALTVFALLLAFSIAATAASKPQSDPQALALVAKSLAALTGGTSITDATLTGNVTLFAGSNNDTGTATLMAKGMSSGRTDVQATKTTRTDIQNGDAGPQGIWIDADGISHAYSQHNCWTDAAWFFPALSSLTAGSDPTVIFSYQGAETWNGLAAEHILIFRTWGSSDNELALTQRLTAMDFYLDAVSLLPLAVRFNVHPDDDVNIGIPTEIRFANYQVVEGVRIPFRIQKLFNDALILDLTVNTAAINVGLPDSDFNIQP